MTDALRPRETDVLRLMDEGLTNRQIAERLYISVETVRWYAKEIYSKLSVHNRAEAVHKARHLGLLHDTQLEQLPAATISHNLPPHITPFVGREHELFELTQLVEDPHIRLVTVVGIGGIGKTRLALELAHRLTDHRLPNIVSLTQMNYLYFANLAPLTNPTDIVSIIADSVNLLQQSDERRLKQQLLDYMRDKQMLLLLDNCEHLLDGLDIVDEILRSTSKMRILATSRKALGIHGEHVYKLSGMEISPSETFGQVIKSDATQLFLKSAQRAVSDFRLTSENTMHVKRICEIVEGMPLGIEIAATWVRSLTLAEIADELNQSIDLLDTRFQSVRAVFNRSWRLLTESQRQVFERFSLFRSGCTREAAEQVTGANLQELTVLVDSSLLRRAPDGRYAIHELLRFFGEEYLIASGQMDSCQAQHSRYYLQYVADCEQHLKGVQQYETLQRIDHEFENIRVAWLWALRHGELEYIGCASEGLMWYCWFRHRLDVGEDLFAQAQEVVAEHAEHEALWASLLVKREFLYRFKHIVEETDLAHGVAIAQKHDQQQDLALYLIVQARRAHTEEKNYIKALRLYEKALNIYEEVKDQYYIAYTYDRIGYCHSILGASQESLDYTDTSLRIRQHIGDHIGISHALINRAWIYVEFNDISKSIQAYEEAISIAQHHNSRSHVLLAEADLSFVNFAIGEFAHAEILAIQVLSASREIGQIKSEGSALFVLGLVAIIQGDYSTGLQRCLDALPMIRATIPADIPLVNGITALALIGLKRFREAESHVRQAVNANTFRYSFQDLGIVCAAHALLLSDHGNFEQAAYYLSFLFNSHYRAFDWVKQCDLLNQLQVELRQKLGDDAFLVLWEQVDQPEITTVDKKLSRFYAGQLF